jgi:hypothetical protein
MKKKKTHKFSDRFDKKDIAQMLTSIFVIVQIFSIPHHEFELLQSFSLFFVSVIVCGFIVWLISSKDFLTHLLVGILIVTLFSFLIGFVLNQSINTVFIAMTVGLPVATMVNALKE